MGMKRILPLGVIVVFILAIGISMIQVVASEERKTQQQWDEVLAEDADLGARARLALPLIDELEELERSPQDGTEKARELGLRIIELWPQFRRSGENGEVTLAPTEFMRKQLLVYASRR